MIAESQKATNVNLLEYLAFLTLPRVSAIDVLGIPESLTLFLRGDRRFGFEFTRGAVESKKDVDILVAGGVVVRVHNLNQ